MKTNLFQDFESVTSKQWKQQIQFELKGADYNETLVWESPEGIKVKPFYHSDEEVKTFNTNTKATEFNILQNIFVHDIQMSNKKAKDSLNRGAESIRFTIESDKIELAKLMENLPLENVTYYFNLPFLSTEYIKSVNDFASKNNASFIIQIDPIGQLCKEGNWFENLNADFDKLNEIAKNSANAFLNIQSGTYQNAGANMVQQLAYTLAHVNEYFNRISAINQQISIEVAVGTNYFFEIAKLRALRLLFSTLAKEYNHTFDCQIVAIPTKRNKTLYDYNVNMLRTTTECMSAILGGANSVSNLAYDAIYHKDNEFGDRISRNQLLVLKEESYFDKVNNPADGAYYIETLTEQLAEKALELFKDIEANGGLITQLIEGTIQRKISESAQKEQELFDSGKEILLGTNKYPNPNDKMKHDLELFPFVKTKDRKTLISPIIEKRLSEKLEQERLSQEE
ncbi:methylmalonyl-CoA mutase subunit beta [Flavobacterium urocaniciphilum]|uniref:Heterodimeric methylmalonyl-CoA mutase small subunit n=1 Tax=Flavobacterium urocaniciphilum TaxID=1299341 RepID=A0A1H9D7E8_9FLAO|nr:methylmalonyl-CoA mutase subunit beta [Flavobacterium urocaniciphilum]SEQ09309.1 heterodimeric methylmalonyl-CoA mutase small subunit [Flavobacterium urocaniciphilum]